MILICDSCSTKFLCGEFPFVPPSSFVVFPAAVTHEVWKALVVSNNEIAIQFYIRHSIVEKIKYIKLGLSKKIQWQYAPKKPIERSDLLRGAQSRLFLRYVRSCNNQIGISRLTFKATTAEDAPRYY
ncbi:unnamed protein product [Gordionus sp. m RMFG-2023]